MRKQIVGLLFSTIIFSMCSMQAMKRSSAYDIENSNLSNTILPPMIYPDEIIFTKAYQLTPIDHLVISSHPKKKLKLDTEYPHHSYLQQDQAEIIGISKVAKEKKTTKKKSAVSKKNRSGKQLYVCQEKNCIYQTTSGKDMTKHKELHYQGGMNEVCQECGYIASNERTYNTHMRRHSDILESNFHLLSAKTSLHGHVSKK